MKTDLRRTLCLLPLCLLLMGPPRAEVTAAESSGVKVSGADQKRTMVVVRRLRGRALCGSGDDWDATVPDKPILILEFEGKKRMTDSILSRLKGLTALRTLDISGTRVTGAGLMHLELFPKLRRVELAGTDVSDLTQIPALPGLDTLGLSGTKVTDESLAALKKITGLVSLDIGETAVTDAGLAHLEGLKKLQWLYVSKTKVTAAGVEKLGEALPGCKIVQ